MDEHQYLLQRIEQLSSDSKATQLSINQLCAQLNHMQKSVDILIATIPLAYVDKKACSAVHDKLLDPVQGFVTQREIKAAKWLSGLSLAAAVSCIVSLWIKGG